MTIVNLGLGFGMIGWRLIQYVDCDTLSRLPLEDYQIDYLADYLNWDILSGRQLAGWLFVKYAEYIDWPVFLTNGYAKDVRCLTLVKHKLQENIHVFFNTYVKKMYYTPSFIITFPELIDWKWCAKHVQLADYILLRYWNKIPINILCRYQRLSNQIIEQKIHCLKWQYISRHPMSEDFMSQIAHYLNWDTIMKYQCVSMAFIEKYQDLCSPAVVSQYQKLSEDFILKHHKWLDLKIVSRYQNLSSEFIITNYKLLDFSMLEKNTHYNKKNTIQIIKRYNYWYIIDAPIVQLPNPEIIYCVPNYIN